MSKSLIAMTVSIILGLGIFVFLFLDSNVDSSNSAQTGSSIAVIDDLSSFSGNVVSAAGSLVIGGEPEQGSIWVPIPVQISHFIVYAIPP